MEDILEAFLKRQKAVLDSGDKGDISRVFYGYKGALGIQAAAFNQYLGEQSGTLASAQIATKAVINEIYRRMGDLAKDLQGCDIPDAVRPQVTQAYLSMATSRYLQKGVDITKLQEFAQANNNVLKVTSQFIKDKSLEECRVFMLDVIRKPKPSKTMGTIASGAGGLLARISRIMWAKEEKDVEIKKVDAEVKQTSETIYELLQNPATLAQAFVLSKALIKTADAKQNAKVVSGIMEQVAHHMAHDDFSLTDLRRVGDYLLEVRSGHGDLSVQINRQLEVIVNNAKKLTEGKTLEEYEQQELQRINRFEVEQKRPLPPKFGGKL